MRPTIIPRQDRRWSLAAYSARGLLSKRLVNGDGGVVLWAGAPDEIVLRGSGSVRGRQAHGDFDPLAVVGEVPSLRIVPPVPEMALDRFGQVARVTLADVEDASDEWQFVVSLKGHSGAPLISSGWQTGAKAMEFDLRQKLAVLGGGGLEA